MARDGRVWRVETWERVGTMPDGPAQEGSGAE